MPDSLPDFPAHAGPRAATRLRRQADFWEGLADELDAEVLTTDDAFGAALSLEDERASNRARVSTLGSSKPVVPGRDQ
jgi:hypothetical protein